MTRPQRPTTGLNDRLSALVLLGALFLVGYTGSLHAADDDLHSADDDLAIAIPAPDQPVEQDQESEKQADDTDDDNEKAQPVTIVERPDEDLLLLELRLNDMVLVDAMFAYLAGSSIVLPLRDFTEVLDFSIAVDTASATADGWFLAPNRLFSLNVGRGEIIIDGKSRRFDKRLVEVHEEDIFVDIRLIARWFPVDLQFDLSNLLVEIESREPLPIEQRLAREDYRQRVLAKRGSDPTANLKKAEIPYRAISVPMVDVSAESTLDKDSGSKSRITTQHNITMTGDLAFANAELFIGGDNREKVDNARLRLERVDPNGQALAGIAPVLDDVDVTEAKAGDIFSPQLSLISQTELGRGIQLSNMPIDAPTEFDRITLTGELPLGWEVEVYRNEILLDFQTSRSDGQYEFEDVPLVFGVNVIRIVFYGPQGQVREEIRQFTVGPGQTKTGELDMRFTANQQDRPLLLRDEDADEDLEGRGRLFYEAQYGVSRNLTIGGNVAQIPLENGTERYLTATASYTFGEVFGRIDAVNQIGGGWANRYSAQTRQFGMNMLAEHTLFNSFVSEQVNESTDPIDSSSKLRIDGALPDDIAGFIPRIPFSFTIDHDRRESRDSDTSVQNRLSAAVGPASVTNTLNYQLDKSDESTASTLSGTTLIGGRFGAFRTRGSIGYDVVPEKELQNVGLSGDWTINRQWRGSLGVTRNFGEDTETTYTLGVNAQLEQAAIGFDIDYSDTDQIVSKMSVTFGLGYDPESGEIAMQASGTAHSGAMSALVFLDFDADGVLDDEDEPLEGVRFTVDQGRHTTATDEDGKAFITRLPVYKEIALEIDRASLIDPFWVASPQGVKVVARPGSVGQLLFPVVSTGEIDGTVFRAWTDGTQEAAGVIVQLMSADGELVRELKTAYDGFFLFDFVPPGDYTLRVDPDQMALLGLIADTEYPIEIQGDGTIVSGQDFLLTTPAVAAMIDVSSG